MSILGNLNLNNFPIIYLNCNRAWVPNGIELGLISTDVNDYFNKLTYDYANGVSDRLVETYETYKSYQFTSVVPKSILDNVVLSCTSLIQSIFYLNVLGAGLIAVSAIGLYYTKPEYKKTRLGLQALFIAGLASVVFAAFKANSSIISLQKLGFILKSQ